MVPRLLHALGATFRTFSLLQGANDALISRPLENNIADAVASRYRQVCAELIVVQLNALLDRNHKRVSFQTVHQHLKIEAVREALIADAALKVPDAKWFPDQCRRDISQFMDAYNEIDWADLHGRLKHFRDYAVAHIFEERFQKTVTLGDVKRLVADVTLLGTGLAFLIRPKGIDDEESIRMWTQRTTQVWRAALKNVPS